MKNIFNRIKQKSITMMAAAFAALAAVVPVTASAAPIDFSGVTMLDVTPTDAMSTGFSFSNQFTPWQMLVFGLILAPVAIGFVLWLLGKLPKFGKSKAAT